ncbi:hypothetical protein WOLCODRAFT_141014 [Wolfiporia cocos MD-104 SS10]|uniref:RING-type domain-containing protein n=1 Tax=Wolfiporia cocos (strain MD-104) TaxID=742152 RepID=A0A2H3J9M8_WOLCO|nr:hypothetical protein WOLCODRAFT_141014 [Wolfiporia cocos MD-104 SS10]
MISLKPGSLCDVCAEEYGPHNYPHSIPCGHILCLHCCNHLIEKPFPRLTPSCPFCREPFTSDAIRLIRVDFGSSGNVTPLEAAVEAPESGADGGDDDDEILLLNPGVMKSNRAEARRLEYKVAKVATKKCSLEEVQTLQDELQSWLKSDVKRDDQNASLQLSSALLHAIIVNHMAHKNASEIARATEARLQHRLEEVENAKEQLEAELQRLKSQYAAKTQEVQTLRAELSRVKIRTASSISGARVTPPPGMASAQTYGSTSPPRPPSSASYLTSRSGATSPTSPTPPRVPPLPSLFGRTTAASGHTRSASTVPSHRSMTPAARPASAIPTPKNTSSAGSDARHHIPLRQSLSSPTPSAPKMTRSSSSSSDEQEKERDRQRHQLIERWIPTIDPAKSSPPASKLERYHMAFAAARTTSSTPVTLPPTRYKTPVSARSP